jgi:PAS domain S-box-containing protein
METIDNILREQTAELAKSNASLMSGIPEREKAKMVIDESHKDIEHLISSIPTILIGLSKNNEVLYWNTKTEKVLNTAAAQVMGLPLGQCEVDWDWDKVADGISQSRIENLPTRVDDVEFRRPDGEERYLGLTINPLNVDNDSILGVVIIGADITDRKKIEVQLQQSHKMEAIGQLAAGIAHEINTPTQFVGDNTRFFQDAFVDLIEIIKTYKELIETARSSPLTDEMVQKAEDKILELDFDYLLEEVPLAIQHTLKGVDRIAKIVQAMKVFAHPGMCEKELTSINKEIEKTITITRNEWKYVAELITDFDPSLPPVPCFRAELNQVILNMIVNAAHAIADVNKDNPSQKGTIRVRTHHEGNWAKIYISDTGAGIPEDIREKIFDLFFTTKTAGKGSGQGLAISHSVIVEKHNGTIDLESQEGNGTTFIIGLPLEVDQEQDD